MKTVFQALIGAIVGFFVMYAVLTFREGKNVSFAWPIQEMTIVALICSVICLIYIIAGTFATKKLSKTIDEEDVLEELIYNKFLNISIANIVGFILAIFSLSIAIIGEIHSAYAIVACVLLIVIYIMQSLNYNVMRKAYHYRPFPRLSDKNYPEELLAMTDEGERHVMFGGLYKLYISINILLPVAILVLMFYSSISGQSQLFSIVILTAIFIYINVRYLRAVRPN